VGRVVSELGHLEVLVNNASQQHVTQDLTDITPTQLEKTFATNVFGYFYMAKVRRHCWGCTSLQCWACADMLSAAFACACRPDLPLSPLVSLAALITACWELLLDTEPKIWAPAGIWCL
jgi:hypothetical protein